MNIRKNKKGVTLSERELEILELVSDGLTNLEISQRLEISKRTVDNHITNILNKTATGNRVELLRWALQWGKICIDDVNCCPINEEIKPEFNQESQMNSELPQP